MSCVFILWHNTLTTKAIDISGSRHYEPGGTTNITCSTPVPVHSMQWVDESNTVVSNGTAVQELLLNIMSLNSNHDNTTYGCAVSDGSGFMESRHITISVGCKITVEPLYVTGFMKRGHFTQNKNFELAMLHQSTLSKL